MKPRPYQETGRDFLAARRQALLADEMRVGKTPQAILAAHKVGARSVLVLCQAIAVPHWTSEFGRWWPDGAFPSNLRIVSYAKAALIQEELLAEVWDVLIVDECHYAKNPEAARTKMVFGKNGLGWRARRLWALSGTPAPRHAGELWPMLRAFGVVRMDYQQFIDRYCLIDYLSGKPSGTRVKMIPELHGMLAKIMLRRKRSEVAPEVPAIDFQFLEVNRSGDADLPEDYERASDEDRIAVAMGRVNALSQHIEFAMENQLLNKFVVFGWHIEPLLNLAATLRAHGLRVGVINGMTPPKQRAEIQAAFKKGLLDGVLANIITAGTSIDLSTARHAYFIELSWSPADNTQAANRLINMTMKDKVTVDVATCPGTVDDRVQQRLLTLVRQLAKLY